MCGGMQGASQIFPDYGWRISENKDIIEYLYSCQFLLDINHVFLINDEDWNSLRKHPILYNDKSGVRKSVWKSWPGPGNVVGLDNPGEKQ